MNKIGVLGGERGLGLEALGWESWVSMVSCPGLHACDVWLLLVKNGGPLGLKMPQKQP